MRKRERETDHVILRRRRMPRRMKKKERNVFSCNLNFRPFRVLTFFWLYFLVDWRCLLFVFRGIFVDHHTEKQNKRGTVGLDLFIVIDERNAKNRPNRMIYRKFQTFFLFFSLQNLWSRAFPFRVSSECRLIGRNTSAGRCRRKWRSSIVWRARRAIMDLDARLCVASVTIISGTLPAQRVARKFVFPVGRANTVPSVSVSHFFFDFSSLSRIPTRSSKSQQFCCSLFTTSFRLPMTIDEKRQWWNEMSTRDARQQSLEFKYQSRVVFFSLKRSLGSLLPFPLNLAPAFCRSLHWKMTI